jgi:hypothetical protein
MKIAVWHNLHSGGGSRALQYHIQGLISAGHEVEIWADAPDADGFMKGKNFLHYFLRKILI